MQTYEKKKAASAKGGKAAPAAPMQQSVPNSAFLTDGASRIDLPEAMRSKMESAYGTDLSAVKIYQSQKVADNGAEAVTMGNTIAFAPGKFDMTSQSGQALLGHEMSHVVSQSRGEVQGRGVVENAALEARADREGAMAAAGEQVYNGPVTAPISSASPAGVAGPMQCKKNKLGKHGNDKAGGSFKMAKMNADGTYKLGFWSNKVKMKNVADTRTNLEVADDADEETEEMQQYLMEHKIANYEDEKDQDLPQVLQSVEPAKELSDEEMIEKKKEEDEFFDDWMEVNDDRYDDDE